MDFFDRHKALIITILIFAVLFLSLYNLNLSNNNRKTEEMLVNLESFRELEAAKEKAKEEASIQEKKPSKPIQTHHAFNENEEAREENFNNQLDEIFKKNSAAQQEASTSENKDDNGNYQVSSSPKKQEPQKKSTGNNSTDKTSVKKGSMRNSSISFSLRDRTAIDIPNPVYTCDVAGKVVVNITVNAEGMVLTTTINKASSNTTNECLLENAQMYAAQARFSRFPGRNSQLGTITYYFER